MFEDVITRQTKLCGRILRALASGSKSVSEIAAALRVDKGGDISDELEQLAESGMVARDGGANPATGAAAFLVNDSPEARPVAFDFGGRKPAACRIVDAKRTDAEIPFPATLPPHSFLLVEFA